ncbi:MAG: TolC family protein, partial [Myxococcaceae bacterium]
QVDFDVRNAFFGARAAKALVVVAQETLSNQRAHLEQVQAFVEVGTRPEIDLAQVRTDVANARVQLINAQNDYATSKAQLDLAMGVAQPRPYEVADESPGPLEGEDQPLAALLPEALRARPELAAQANQVRAQELSLQAVQGAYGPSLSISSGITEAGAAPGSMVWNWNAGATLAFPLFQGGLVRAQEREARANLVGVNAGLEALRQQIRLELEQARLAVVAAKESLSATGDALVNARERLRLAEGRYQAGAGNIIELSDAQLALTNAAAQQVRAQYTLAQARAGLQKALSRP